MGVYVFLGFVWALVVLLIVQDVLNKRSLPRGGSTVDDADPPSTRDRGQVGNIHGHGAVWGGDGGGSGGGDGGGGGGGGGSG